MSRTVEDRHLNFGSCMGRLCAAHDKPMQKCFTTALADFGVYLCPPQKI